MANNNQIYKMSNAGGFKSLNRYHDMLAGNPVFVGADFQSIETVTVGSAGQSTITFSSIPQSFKHLQIRAFIKFAGTDYGNLRFNGDTTTTNYRNHGLFGSGSGSASANTAVSSAYFPFEGRAQVSPSILDILDYSNTNKNKVTRELGGFDTNGGGTVYMSSNLWMNTAAITSISITSQLGTFAEFCQFALYGIRG
jgi:hypothetical protein